MANQVQQTQASASDYFNLHVNGLGYLNRVRWVNVKSRGGRKADPFLCCGINALHGSTQAPNRTSFDLKVSGDESIALIDSLADAVETQRKVLISFRAGDIYPHLYDRKVRDEQGRETGQMEVAALIKGRLIRINSVKVEGVVVYQRPESAQEAQAEPPEETLDTADVQQDSVDPIVDAPQRPAVAPSLRNGAAQQQPRQARRTSYAQA